MITRRNRIAEARLIWRIGRVDRLCPVALCLFIAVNALSRKPTIYITSHRHGE